MDPAHHERTRGARREGIIANVLRRCRTAGGRRYFIWGATAAMLRNLYHFLRA